MIYSETLLPCEMQTIKNPASWYRKHRRGSWRWLPVPITWPLRLTVQYKLNTRVRRRGAHPDENFWNLPRAGRVGPTCQPPVLKSHHPNHLLLSFHSRHRLHSQSPPPPPPPPRQPRPAAVAPSVRGAKLSRRLLLPGLPFPAPSGFRRRCCRFPKKTRKP